MAGCAGTHNEWVGDYDCGYSTKLDCDQCKYGGGRKDPEAWANAPEDVRRDHAKELRRKRRAHPTNNETRTTC